MVKVIVLPYRTETGWIFDTKDEAEMWLRKIGYLKVSDDEWIRKPTRTDDHNGSECLLVIVEEV